MRLAAAILTVVMSGVLLAQDTNDPTDTPTVRALTALLPLRDQANYGRWLAAQERQAEFAEWLAMQAQDAGYAKWLGGRANEAQFALWVDNQTKDVKKAKFAMALAQPETLLSAKAAYNKPNYSGNAFESIRKRIWLNIAEGKTPVVSPQ